MKMRTFLLPAVIALGLLASTNAFADEANLARSKSVSYQYVDEAGEAVTVDKDKKLTKLTDGVRTDKSAVPSDWGPNKKKALRVRFDFTREVNPSRLVIIWMFAHQDLHKIDRIRVLAGDEPTALEEVKVFDEIERTGRNVPIDISLPETSGRYLEVVLEQDASPEHKMFSISEIEVFGPESERQALDGE